MNRARFGSTVLGLATVLATPQICIADAKTDAANRKTMHAYASCVVRKDRERASQGIRANADNAMILHDYSQLISSACLGQVAGDVQMKFGGDLYRYALADALVNDAFATRSEASFADRLPLAHLSAPDRALLDTKLAKTKSRRKRAELEEEYAKQSGVAWLSRYGECIVRDNPVKARLWLLTPPDVPEETSRINDLRPSFATCVEGGTMRFNRVVMRGTVAINYYRLAMAPPVAGKTQ